MTRKARVLVTGGTGFIGRHVVSRLSSRGHAVRVLVRGVTELARGVEAFHGDLERPAELAPGLEGVDHVVHAAALLDPIHDADAAGRVNRIATEQLFDAAARAGCRSFVFLSSQAAVGFHPGGGLVAPDAECRPTTIYGRSKRDAERALLARSATGPRLVVLRPPTVYGPGERRNFLALTRAVDSGFFVVPGSGANRMSMCWVGNLADACLWALDADAARGIVHVADEPVLSFREIVETLGWALGRPPLPVPFPQPLAWAVAFGAELAFGALHRDPPLGRARLQTLTADCALDTRATRRLGFVPGTRFTEGVARTVAWYRDEGLVRAR